MRFSLNVSCNVPADVGARRATEIRQVRAKVIKARRRPPKTQRVRVLTQLLARVQVVGRDPEAERGLRIFPCNRIGGYCYAGCGTGGDNVEKQVILAVDDESRLILNRRERNLTPLLNALELTRVRRIADINGSRDVSELCSVAVAENRNP